MLIEYKKNGKRVNNITSNGKIILDENLNELKGKITYDVPSLEMFDIDLSELNFNIIKNGKKSRSSIFVKFQNGFLEVYNENLKKIVNFDDLNITIIEKEVEYCMDCQGGTIITDEPCLNCGGDGTLW